MRGEARTGRVSIHEARIRLEVRKARERRGAARQRLERGGQWRPDLAGQRIARTVAIPAAIADPADGPAVRHGHRHRLAARRYEVTERRLSRDGVDDRHELRGAGEAAQQRDAITQTEGISRRELQLERAHGPTLISRS